MEPIENPIEKLEWTQRVPIFQTAVILKQLALAVGIPFGVLCIFLWVASGNEGRIYALYALGMIAALFILTFLLIMVLYGGKYDVGFVIDDKGILCATQPQQAKKNRIINGLAVVLGLLSGKPAVAGAGILAGTRQSIFIKWNDIKRAKYDSKQHVIMLKGNLTESMAVFCTAENYDQVRAIIISKIKA